MYTNSINSRNWELLLNAVDEGRVVPVIGDALIQVRKPDGETAGITDYLLDKLRARFKATPETCPDFSALENQIESFNYQQRNIGESTDLYYEIYDCLKNVDINIPPFLEELFRECRSHRRRNAERHRATVFRMQ